MKSDRAASVDAVHADEAVHRETNAGGMKRKKTKQENYQEAAPLTPHQSTRPHGSEQLEVWGLSAEV